MERSKEILNEISGHQYPFFIAGPCSVENYNMMDKIVSMLVSKGIKMIRAGAFKPRTSPNNFQGLGLEGLRILNEIRNKYKVKIVSEIVDIKYLDKMCDNIDILQVGARNMYNYELLKALGKTGIPIILKRGISATIHEFKCAAEYISQGGNKRILLCERGIRSYDRSTRNVLDLSCVAILKKETEYPVLVDISHSLGRKDIALAMTRASLAVGADGIMVEVHNDPRRALSDSNQQMSLLEFDRYYNKLVHENDTVGGIW